MDYIEVLPAPVAPYIYTDFDDQINVEFSGLPNNPETVANPDVSGINTSENVGKWVRSTELDSHIFTVLDSKIDFTSGQVFRMKVHSPVICNVLFMLEDSLNVALPVERLVAITNVNQWENLLFDFTGTGSGLYDKITIFFDFGSANNNTFYFDDLMGPELEEPVFVKPYLALDVQDNFENDGYATISEWNFQDPGIVPLPVVVDPLNPSNHVADYNRSGSFQYTNAQFILDHRMDLTNRNKFGMKVFFPSSNNYTGALTKTAAIKLQNSLLGGNAYTTQAEILVTVTQLDQWVNLTFDFSAPEITSRTDFDQVVVQFGGEGHLEPALFYFDDFRLLGIQEVIQQTVQLTGGWSGLSGYVVPDNTNLDDMLASLENLVILYNNDGIYMPSQGTNTLGNWNPAQGYVVKLTGSDELVIEGFETANPTLTLATGWSIVPVISSCNVDLESLLGEYEQIVMVKEVAGTGVYWPEKAFNSLGNLVPGKAYFFLTNAAVSFTYPACGTK